MQTRPENFKTAEERLLENITIERTILHKGRMAKMGTAFYIARYKCEKTNRKMTMCINVNTTGMTESQELSIKKDLKTDFIKHFKL